MRQFASDRAEWTRERLIAEARRAGERAYEPYSHFRVGAVVVVETAASPQLVAGVNVENASYGLALCAERAALAAACALADGLRQEKGAKPRIIAIAVSCLDADELAPAEERMPCGACRQWLAELAPDAVCYVDGVEGEWRVEELLPHAFRLKSKGANE